MNGSAVVAEQGRAYVHTDRRHLALFGSAIVALAIGVVAHLLVVLLVLPAFQELYRGMTGVAWPARAVATVADLGMLPGALVALDVVFFVLFYRLASRRSVALLFAPVVWYVIAPLLLLLAAYQPLLGMVQLIHR